MTNSQQDAARDAKFYFRFAPNLSDWAVLLLMNLLNLINYLFQDKEKVQQMQQICDNGIKRDENFTKARSNAIRCKNFIQSYLIFAVIGVLIYFIGQAQVNLISWIFFILNMMMLSLIAKGDDKESTNRYTKQVCTVIKVYSTLILVSDILFICFIGEKDD